MIKEFLKKQLFFPRNWANAVARWISGVNSPDGSIIVKNTLNPGQDGSLELKVNLDRIVSEVAKRYNLEGQIDRNTVRDTVWDMVDGASVIVDGRRISVNKEWINEYIAQHSAVVGGEEEDNIETDPSALLPDCEDENGSIGTSGKLVYSDHVHPLSYPVAPASPTDLGGGVYTGMANHGTTAGGSRKDAAGMTFLVACSFGEGGASGRLWFRPITVSKDGRIVSVGAATESVKVNTDY